MDNRIIIGECLDPWYNLALEELLFEQQENRPGVAFYLWQNQNTVVIGKNQNAWQECRISLLEGEDGKLARRSSGGGAVFHDLGNLNFTFVVSRERYDVRRQLSVISRAVQGFGVTAEFSGRNDLVAKENGAKFSGNAYRFSSKVALHHGTLLVNANMEKLSRYLAPAPDKLHAKGIKSVRARVCNLSELAPDMTVERLKKALCNAFIAEYGPALLQREDAFTGERLSTLAAKHASWDWRLGKTPQFDVALEQRFGWGGVTLHLTLSSGRIQLIDAYSDAMDEAFISLIPPALQDCPFNSREMAARFVSLARPEAIELADWILEKGF